MELILIRDDRLKIMLTESDMASYSLSCDNIDYDNTETRRALWSILDKAKHKVGFDAATSRILIQVYTSKCGGCEMYITKLSGNEKGCLLVSKESDIEKEADIFGFNRLCDLSKACASLKEADYNGKGLAYYDGKRYFLELCRDIDDTKNKYCFINEYASLVFGSSAKALEPFDEDGRGNLPLSPSMAKAYINEHCRMLSENAIEDLSPLC